LVPGREGGEAHEAMGGKKTTGTEGLTKLIPARFIFGKAGPEREEGALLEEGEAKPTSRPRG